MQRVCISERCAFLHIFCCCYSVITCMLFYLLMLLNCVTILVCRFVFFFFFMQKTDYEMRISDWSSDVCSSDLTELLTGLDHPWAIAFLPDDSGALITEKPGHLRLWKGDGKLSEPISGLPQVYTRSQGGLLDVALAPDFAQNRHVYLSFAEQGDDGSAGTAVGYGTLSADGRRLANLTVIFRQTPKLARTTTR